MNTALQIRAGISRTIYAARSTAAQSEEDISCLRYLDAPARLVDSECGCAALQLESAISGCNGGMPLDDLYAHWHGTYTPAQWGHYVAAQALGLCTRLDSRYIKIPSIADIGVTLAGRVLTPDQYESLVMLMDGEIREDLHDRGYGTEQEFLEAYLVAHEAKFGSDFKFN